MKQILQNQRTGDLTVAEVPAPILQRGRVLVRTAASLISAGTERLSLQLAQKNLLGKARERPDLVKQVVQKYKTEGLVSTINAVRAKLDTNKALGYSASGTVLEVGGDVSGLHPGDRVACAGADFASHAEVLSVPRNLCVRLPAAVNFEAGAFGTLGAIALQGLRLAEPTLGEAVVVIGLGLLGQLTVQLLKANGCRVCGVDLDQAKVDCALELGADAAFVNGPETKQQIIDWSRGRGADAVLITAASSSNEPIEMAGEISRPKGRVVVVGLVGLDVPRQSFYERELSLKVSMSYGPGRYDPDYEEHGHDYPFAYVRWTEQRNIEAFLDMIAAGRVNVERLISHRFPIRDANKAYELITHGGQPYLGVLLTYDERPLAKTIEITKARRPNAKVRVGVIGAGSYLTGKLLPQFKDAGVEFRSIATASGVSGTDAGKKFGFAQAVSSADEVLADDATNLIIIGTRHDSHADLVTSALRANRHVFVEKPLAMNVEQLEQILEAERSSEGSLMVGFNRRFAPLSVEGRDFFSDRRNPLSILYRVNAGRIAKSHWVQDADEGGGRIIGEACHFIDLMQYWTSAPPVTVFAEAISSDDAQVVEADSVFITLRFADGSNGCIAYVAEGDKTMPKERIEIFGGGKTFVLDDFRRATFHKNGKEQHKELKVQDKGQAAMVRAVFAMVRDGGPSPIPVDELSATTLATFRIIDSLRSGERQDVRAEQ
ncbi:MAG TPA: bi-domain-containing oxidoreductase [Pyrinomonadaceae bacterium]|nr:bi-domain-containing oxidoreductase [Pyrinomonadaceae bacterium]